MLIPVLSALAAAFLFGAAAPLGKVLLQSITPFQLAALLYGGAALGSLIVLVARREGVGLGRHLDTRNAMRLSGAIVSGGILGPVFLLEGLHLSSAASVSLWLVLEMAMTALLGHLFFRDYLGRWGWAGVAGCLTGSLILSWEAGPAGFAAGAWVAAACLAWGLDNNLTSLIDGLKPVQTVFWKGLIAAAVNGSLGWMISWAHPPAVQAVWGLALGAVSYGASIALYIRAAHALGATRSQMVFATAPAFGLILSCLIYQTSLSWVHVAALAIFAGSLALLFHDKHAHAHTHEAMEHEHLHRHDDGHHTHVHPGTPPSLTHAHRHAHESITHSHPHWPDLHHRHAH